jgi:hypothetical protein
MGNSTPDAGKAYGEGLQAYLKYLGPLLRAEQNARTTYDPQRAEEQLALYDTYDPKYQQIRGAMEDNVLQGVQSGYNLPPALQRVVQQDIRGAQAARGNIYGNAPISAEAAYGAKNSADLYNTHLAQAGTFLGMPSPAQVDRAPGYTAGGLATANSVGNNAFQAALNTPNPWATALGGAASGAATGASVGGGWGALIGGVVGGAGGYLSSDERMKENIVDTGERTRDDIPIVTFNYKDGFTRFRGVIAQMVEKIRPDAVKDMPTFNPRRGDDGMRKWVDYRALGIGMEYA